MVTSKPPAGTGRTVKDWLAQDGAPWRPFDYEGLLVKPQRTARSASAIFAACEAALVGHLKTVCLWPDKQRNKTWRIGDFPFCIIGFSPAVLMDLPWLPPGVRENSMDLFGLAAEKVTKERVPGFFKGSSFPETPDRPVRRYWLRPIA